MAEAALQRPGEPGVVSGSPHPGVAAVAGFLLGGVVADTFTNVASVLIAGGSLGGLLGAFLAAIRHTHDVERLAGYGALPEFASVP